MVSGGKVILILGTKSNVDSVYDILYTYTNGTRVKLLCPLWYILRNKELICAKAKKKSFIRVLSFYMYHYVMHMILKYRDYDIYICNYIHSRKALQYIIYNTAIIGRPISHIICEDTIQSCMNFCDIQNMCVMQYTPVTVTYKGTTVNLPCSPKSICMMQQYISIKDQYPIPINRISIEWTFLHVIDGSIMYNNIQFRITRILKDIPKRIYVKKYIMCMDNRRVYLLYMDDTSTHIHILPDDASLHKIIDNSIYVLNLLINKTLLFSVIYKICKNRYKNVRIAIPYKSTLFAII